MTAELEKIDITPTALTNHLQLRGIEKAAIILLCLPDKRAADLMEGLEENDVRMLSQAMSTLGTIPAETVETVIREFSLAVAGGDGVVGSVDNVKRLLSGFMPEGRVAEIIEDIRGPNNGRTKWESFSSLNEQFIADHLKREHDQTVAAIMTKARPDVAARVLPLFGQERMADITVRMFRIDTLSRVATDAIEEVISAEILPSATRKSGPDPQQRIADMFNKMDGAVFEELSSTLEERVPETFAAIKKKMFVFDDLAKLSNTSMQRLLRAVQPEGTLLALALRGLSAEKKIVKDAFTGALTVRANDILSEQMASLGSVRARDARDAQARIIDIANDLARQDAIQLPSEDEPMID